MTDKRRKGRTSPNAFSPEVELLLKRAAKEAAGKPLGDSLKPQSGSLMSQMIARMVELAMDEEMTDHLGYEPNERITFDQAHSKGLPRRPNTRNGHTTKSVVTSYGPVDIEVPRDRLATFAPTTLPKRQSLSQELQERIVAMYTAGMSTRDIEEHIEEFYGADLNSDFISRLTVRMDQELIQWRNRPLEALYPVVLVDAIHLKVRHTQGVESTAVYQVCAYTDFGVLEILGLYMAPDGQTGESATFWHKVFAELHSRGMRDVLILCADGLEGLQKAARAIWPQLYFSPCVVHLVRSSTKYVASKDREKVCSSLKQIYQAPSFEAAMEGLDELERQWKEKYPKVVELWQGHTLALEGLWSMGPMLRKLIYTTNAIENVHNQQRKVLKTKRSFPNRDSSLRLMTLLARKINDKAFNRRTRPDWKQIVAALQIQFEGRIPENWGSVL